QSWNLGISFLCFWLSLELLLGGINSVVWADNATLKLYVYCDIDSHVQLATFIVKPACTLLISRRLYKIASLRSVQPPTRREKVVDCILEWTLGLGLPVLVTGVFYYIVQSHRFIISEGYGCGDEITTSGLSLLLVNSWLVIFPAISVFFYCPKIMFVFYRHSRETNYFLRNDNSVSRLSYLRLLVLASLDIVMTLPLGIVNVVEDLKAGMADGTLQFYAGWESTHSDWEPVSYSYAELREMGGWSLINFDLNRWCSVVLSFVIFALFGLTVSARATY
ncbi:GPCR fungal pheromone mating factor, partial [Vararia minispora EC-137]